MRNTILFTGTNPEAYSSLGEIIHFPLIELHKITFTKEEFQSLIPHLDNCHLILLTSRFAVQCFFEILKEHNYPLVELKIKDFVVVGRQTAAALEHFGFQPTFVPENESSAGLFKEMKGRFELAFTHILFPRSTLSNPYLKEELIKEGAVVEEFNIYKNVKPKKRPLPGSKVDKVFFTSPSTVRNFLDAYKKIPRQWRVLCKGPLTKDTLQKAGYEAKEVGHGPV